MPEDVNRIIDRIRKLLAMADDKSSPREAAIAADRARRLMDAWQIQLHDIPEASKFSTGAAGKARKYTAIWEQMIAVALARLNDCQTVWVRKSPIGGYHIGFRGYTPDVNICVMVFEHLVSAASSECKIALTGKKYNARLGTKFKQAFASEIVDRIDEMIKMREAMLVSELDCGTSMILSKRSEVEKLFGKVGTREIGIRMGVLTDERLAEELGSKAGQAAALFLGMDQAQARLKGD